MSAENEAYVEMTRLLRELSELGRRVEMIDASDTASKQQVLTSVQESGRHLREALRLLAGLV